MLPALADLAALSARVPGGIPAEDEARAQSALEDASALVRDECGRDFVDDEGELDAPAAVVRVVLGVARRDFMNPDGARSDTETVGPHSRTMVRPDDQTGLYLTDQERAICHKYRPGAGGGLRTISTTRADGPALDTIWVDMPYGERFPLQASWEFTE